MLSFRSIISMPVGPLGFCEIARCGNTITAIMGPLHQAARWNASNRYVFQRISWPSLVAAGSTGCVRHPLIRHSSLELEKA
jgi:hypothetical protein